MAADDPQLKFRVPADLRRRLDEAAEQNHRSVSAEVVARLESTFPRYISDPALLPERIEPIDDTIQRLMGEAERNLVELREMLERKALVDALMDKENGDE